MDGYYRPMTLSIKQKHYYSILILIKAERH